MKTLIYRALLALTCGLAGPAAASTVSLSETAHAGRGAGRLHLAQATCVPECQRRLTDRTRLCQVTFESTGSAHYHNTATHRTCLENARTEFDNCRSLCR